MTKKSAKSFARSAKRGVSGKSTAAYSSTEVTSAAYSSTEDATAAYSSTEVTAATQEQLTKLYREELKRLYLFAARWQAALPVDDCLSENVKRKAVISAIKEIITDNKTINTPEQGREIVARITAALAEGGKINGASDVFDLNEVLNPGELDLESLCKELGVMD